MFTNSVASLLPFHSRKSRLKYLYTLLGLCIFCTVLNNTVAQTSTEKFIDIDGYIKYNAVSDTNNNYLRGAEEVLEIRFRYCNDYGMLLYQNGGNSGDQQNYFFALGVNAQRIYLEWRVSDSLIELYIGEGNLQPNTTYSVIIYNLGTPFVGSTFATINSQPVTVDFLTPFLQRGLDMTLLAGALYIGGYESVNDLRVNTERLNGYLVTCVQYIRTGVTTINLDLASEQYGVRDGCPNKFCAPPTIITVESSTGYLAVDHPLPPGTRTIIVLKFRTRASNGMLLYFGGPAYLTVYMQNGRLVLGLNTKGEGQGAFSDQTFLTYNDGAYYSIRITREGGVARMENELGVELARVQYTGAAQTLNAGELMIGGVRDTGVIPAPFPTNALVSLRGCYEGLRFITYSISSEPPELIDFDEQVKDERDVSHGGCFPTRVCEPSCPAPSQACNFECYCAPGFEVLFSSPLQCRNINDCDPNPCLNGATCLDGIQDYTCQCTIEFNKGKDCSIPNFCIPNQCLNNGQCNDGLDGFNCTCAPGYSGTLCGTEIDECQSGPCKNNAFCVDQIAEYICQCRPGFNGSDCEIDIDECASYPCLNAATCTDFVNGYTCSCAPGWTGTSCSSNIDECLSNPCRNGAICIDQVNAYFCQCMPGWEGPICSQDVNECASTPCLNGALCTHGINFYSCLCAPGWSGDNCEQDINECLSVPCQNGALCIDGINLFTCQCSDGYEGRLCDININECASFPCFNAGTCSDRINGYLCQCPPAWKGLHCKIEVNECESSPCRNSATCNDFIGYYTCSCQSGFVGTLCEIDVDECISLPCLNGADCNDVINGYTCSCASGFEGTICEIDINECASFPCLNSGTCLDIVNGYQCACSSGWSGARCGEEVNECDSNPCENSGTCVDRVSSFFCSCAAGFEGFRCDIDIDECISNLCQNGATCIDGINSYSCQCSPGWEGDFCQQDLNECLSDPCEHGGTCFNRVNGFVCQCPSNFQGPTCDLDVNECLTSFPCNPQRTSWCNNTYGDFMCVCNSGFSGKTCDLDVNECESSPCYFDGTCIDLENGYRCECGEEFLGDRCEAVLRNCNFNPCGQNSVCVEHPTGGHTCYCIPGFYGDVCELQANECGSSPCRNGGTCNDFINEYNCTCLAGFDGSDCEVDISECSSSPCENGAVCSEPQLDMYQCQCLQGFEGVNCEIDIDECEVYQPCQLYQVCIDLINDARCECPPGLTGSRCEEYIDSCHSDPCLNGATCLDGNSRYDCVCSRGYTGTSCEIDIDICDPNPCFHRGTCAPFPSMEFNLDFTCLCAEGFIGSQCEGDIYECRSNPCQNGGTCMELTDGQQGFSCQCPSEFIGDLCEVDKYGCVSNPCINLGVCQDTDTGYQCQCPSGWTGINCELDIDECRSIGPCSNNGQCVNYYGTYECACDTHWTGQHCEVDVLECSVLPPVCLNGGECIEQAGLDPVCVCSEGFMGQFCEENIDECASSPCRNGATCNDIVAGYVCQCIPGFEGESCLLNVDECASNPCTNGATCADQLDGYFCACPTGYNGTQCEDDVDDCTPNFCSNGATCIDLLNTFTCLCTPGWEGQYCTTEIDECLSSPCENGATCMDEVYGYTCQCRIGYTGPECQFDVDECATNPCLFGICNDFIGYYTCQCFLGYQGFNCTDDIAECASSPCNNGAVCLEPAVNMYQCRCPEGVVGTNCDMIQTISLNGFNYITLNPLPTYSSTNRRRRRAVDQISINFEMVTTEANGVLLYTQGSQPEDRIDHLALELSDGQLHLTYDDGHETASVVLGGQLNNARPHTIGLYISNLQAVVTIDNGGCPYGQCSASVIPSLQQGSLELNGPLYIGGVGPAVTPYIRSKLYSTDNFRGCFQDLNIDNLPVSLSSNPPTATDSAPSTGCSLTDTCTSAPCLNGGRCVNTWLGYTCECAVGFKGQSCEVQTMASFSANSFLYFPGTNAVTEVTFLFSAANQDPGIVLYTLSGVTVLLTEEGALQVQLLELGGINSVTLGQDLNNGDWYTVQLALQIFVLEITVTNTNTGARYTNQIISAPLITINMPVFFGSLHSDALLGPVKNSLDIYNSFTGCMQDLFINYQELSLLSTTRFTITDPPKATAGCPRESLCFPNPCENDGICGASWEGFSCGCHSQYTGSTCEEVLPLTFNGGSSTLQLVIDSEAFAFGDRFAIDYRTRDASGIIMRVNLFSNRGGQNDYMQIVITGDKELTFETMFSGVQSSLPITTNVTDAEWQQLSWQRDRSIIRVTHMDKRYTLLGDFPMHTSTHSSVSQVLVGSLTGGDPSTSFQGCLRDVKINNQQIIYVGVDEQYGVTVSSSNILLGCIPVDTCQPDPCSENAVCVDIWNAFKCDCVEGWEGIDCSSSVDDCIGNICENGATCLDTHMNYTCLCPAGFTGLYCQTEINECDGNPCHANNSASCIPAFPSDFSCECLPGYDGKICDVDNTLCAQGPCRNGGTCEQPTDNSFYVCTCPDYYEGTNCETYNACFVHDCQNGATCMSNGITFYCLCPDIYHGSLCEHLDACYDNPCLHDGTCTRVDSNYTCACTVHWQGKDCNEAINKCVDNVCMNGGTCFHDLDMPEGDFICECVAGYSGTLCDVDIDECVSAPCVNGAVCIDSATDGVGFFAGYRCQCLPGYDGINCESDIDECGSSPCQFGGTCRDDVDSYECICKEYYIGMNCEFDLRTCSLGLCQNGAVCLNHEYGFSCVCPVGFGGGYCQSEINTCATSPCQNSGTCRYIGPCVCATLPEEAVACGDDEVCQRTACSLDATCGLRQQTYECDCLSGYEGINCHLDINECSLANPVCLNNALCSNTNGGFSCDCAGTGFTGEFCSQNINECLSQPCLNGGECIDNVPLDDTPFFRCRCALGYIGVLCEDEDNECVSKPCANNGTCRDLVGSYQCDCSNTGFSGTNCREDVDECFLQMDSCENLSQCSNRAGGYTCDCTQDFEGALCQTAISRTSTAAVVVPIFIILILIVVAVLFTYRHVRNSRKMKGKYNPSKAEQEAGGISLAAFDMDSDERLI